MKKILLKILLILGIFGLFIGNGAISTVQARESTVIVTEKIPGGQCVKESAGLYKCKVGSGFTSVMAIMGKLLKYFTFIAGLLGVLTLVIGGIMYSMGGADEGMKTKAKEFIIKSLSGLIVLLLSGLILYAVAPWVYK